MDFNSSYFHKVASSRRTRKILKTITNSSGEVFSREDDIKRVLKTEFKVKFKQCPINTHKLNKYLDLINNEVTNDDNMELTKQVTNLKIKKTIFDIGSEKSLGADGMSAGFY